MVGGDALDEAVDAVLKDFSDGPFIFNLGHGIMPETPIAHVERMLKRSPRLIALRQKAKTTMYEWIKAFHIISVIAWMAGMLYLPRLFVYHCEAPAGSPQSETFKVMEWRLLKIIINPAMTATWIFGLCAGVARRLAHGAVDVAEVSGRSSPCRVCTDFLLAGCGISPPTGIPTARNSIG